MLRISYVYSTLCLADQRLTKPPVAECLAAVPTRDICHFNDRPRRHASQLASILEEALAKKAASALFESAKVYLLWPWRQYISQVWRILFSLRAANWF
jgi:hypothetical protein